MEYAVVVVNGDGSAPVVYGPFITESVAMRFEDRHVDAPVGARAFIVPMCHPDGDLPGNKAE
jgi:hypothetical protein